MKKYMAIILFIILSATVLADMPMERVKILIEDIDENVLLETIGTFAVAALEFEPDFFVINSYEREEDGSFVVCGKIDICKDSVPLSRTETRYKCKSREFQRFPVIEFAEEYCFIVSNVKNDVRVWVKNEGVEDIYRTEVTRFDALKEYRFIDVFSLLGTGNGRKIYKEPKDGSEYKVSWARRSMIVPMEQQDGYIKIAEFTVFGEPGRPEPYIELGWIKLRDNEGKLTVWYEGHHYD